MEKQRANKNHSERATDEESKIRAYRSPPMNSNTDRLYDMREDDGVVERQRVADGRSSTRDARVDKNRLNSGHEPLGFAASIEQAEPDGQDKKSLVAEDAASEV